MSAKPSRRQLGLMRSFPCPVCKSNMRVKSSRMEAPLIRSNWLLCQNVHCGAGFHSFTTIERMTSPSGMAHNLNIPTSFKKSDTATQGELPLFAVTTKEDESNEK